MESSARRRSPLLLLICLLSQVGLPAQSLKEIQRTIEQSKSIAKVVEAIQKIDKIRSSSSRDYLLELLAKEKSQTVREAIYAQLGSYPHKTVLAALAREFKTRDHDGELRAITAQIARLGKKGVALLLKAVRGRDEKRQNAAILGMRHSMDKKAVAVMTSVFPGAERKAKLHILEVFGMQQDKQPLLALAKKAVVDKDPKVRDYAFSSLGAAADPKAAEFLKRAFYDPKNRKFIDSIARGLAGQGSGGLRVLIDGLSAKDAGVQAASIRALGSAKQSVAALRALIDAYVAAREPAREAILQATGQYKITNGLTRLRVDALDSKHPGVRTLALSQLADQGHDVTREGVLEQAADQRLMANAGYRARVVYAMGTVLDEELMPRFLKLCRSPSYQIKMQMRRLFRRDNGRVLDLIGALGFESEDPQDRLTVATLLAEVNTDKSTRLLIAALRDPSPDVSSVAIRALIKRGNKKVVPALEKGLGSDDEETRLQAILSLHKLQKESSRWARRLLGIARKGKGAERFVALDLLRELKYRPALKDAQAMLGSEDWRVRSAAYAFCAHVRERSSIPLLIEALEGETGRLQAENLAALRSLTLRTYRDVSQWRQWWAADGPGFKLPPAPPDAGRVRSSASTMTYYSIPLTSNAVCFLVDVSGSMDAKVGTARITRLKAAQDALSYVIGRVKPEFFFNVIPFNGDVHPWRSELSSATEKDRKDGFAFVKKLRPKGGTNIHDALKLAFADPRVDTIYLLSDGEPSAGQITNQDDLADAVEVWNLSRKILIHTISIGRDSAMMERMAHDSGAIYVRRL